MARTKIEKIISDFNREAAAVLLKRHTQTETGRILGVTQPAISQYRLGKRGWGYVTPEFQERIQKIEGMEENTDGIRIYLMKLAIERYEQDVPKQPIQI